MRDAHVLRTRYREDQNWKDKYKSLRRTFDRTESQLTNQTQEHILLQKENKLLRRKVKRLEYEREKRAALLEKKCDENENLYHKLQTIEQRILGVPKGMYLLKKNDRLKRRLKKLQNELKTMSNPENENEEVGSAYNIVADDIITLVQQKYQVEENNNKLILELKKVQEKNAELSTSLEELWQSNEYLKETRMKDKEELLSMEKKNAKMNHMLTQSNEQISLLENSIDRLQQTTEVMNDFKESVYKLQKKDSSSDIKVTADIVPTVRFQLED